MNKHTGPDLAAAHITGGVATDQRHDSAHKHVTGTAIYIDDMPEPAGTLHGCLGLSTVAHGIIRKMDLRAVRAAPGVVDVMTGDDVPGENDISPTGRHAQLRDVCSRQRVERAPGRVLSGSDNPPGDVHKLLVWLNTVEVAKKTAGNCEVGLAVAGV